MAIISTMLKTYDSCKLKNKLHLWEVFKQESLTQKVNNIQTHYNLCSNFIYESIIRSSFRQGIYTLSKLRTKIVSNKVKVNDYFSLY